MCIQSEHEFKGEARQEDGVLKLDVHPLWPREGRLMLGGYPGSDNEDCDITAIRNRSTVSIRTEGAQTRYLTVIEAYEAASEIESVEAGDADSVTVRLKDGRTHRHRISGFVGNGQDVGVVITEEKGGDMEWCEQTE